jgi:hypothetical protein
VVEAWEVESIGGGAGRREAESRVMPGARQQVGEAPRSGGAMPGVGQQLGEASGSGEATAGSRVRGGRRRWPKRGRQRRSGDGGTPMTVPTTRR